MSSTFTRLPLRTLQDTLRDRRNGYVYLKKDLFRIDTSPNPLHMFGANRRKVSRGRSQSRRVSAAAFASDPARSQGVSGCGRLGIDATPRPMPHNPGLRHGKFIRVTRSEVDCERSFVQIESRTETLTDGSLAYPSLLIGKPQMVEVLIQTPLVAANRLGSWAETEKKGVFLGLRRACIARKCLQENIR